MGRDNDLLVPEAREALDRFKTQVMTQEGYPVNPNEPDDVKYEVAEDMGIQLDDEYNGEMKTKEAGAIGGKIGGSMVREMIKLAEQEMTEKYKR